MANFTDVAVAANKNAPVRDNPGPGSAMDTHQNGVFAILTCTEVVLRQRQTTDIVTNETGHFKTFFQSFYQPPVFYLNMRHVMNFAAVRVNKPWQDHRNRDQLAQFALVAINKLSNGIQQGMFQRLLGTFRQRVMFFCQHFAAEIKQSDGGVVTTKPYADCVEIAGFGDDRDSAAAPGGGLLINFFDQPAFDKLTRNFGYAGGGKLALLGNLNPRDWPVLVNQAINRRAVKLFYEINITYLSLSAWCHTFSY